MFGFPEGEEEDDDGEDEDEEDVGEEAKEEEKEEEEGEVEAGSIHCRDKEFFLGRDLPFRLGYVSFGLMVRVIAFEARKKSKKKREKAVSIRKWDWKRKKEKHVLLRVTFNLSVFTVMKKKEERREGWGEKRY